MSGLRENLAAIDRLIHEPARLAIMTTLSGCSSADFLFLQRLTGMTAGNLSSHLAKLEEAGLLWIDKQIVGKRPRTTIGLTDKGRAAIEAYWKQLEQMRSQAEESGTESQDTDS